MSQPTRTLPPILLWPALCSFIFTLITIIPTVRSANEPATIFAWQQRAPALVDRVEGVSAIVDDKLYTFGGFLDSDLRIAAQVDVYDPVADTWATIGQMPVPTTHLNPIVDGQTVWFAGGFVGDHPGPPTANTWKYDVPSNTWAAGPPLPEPRASGALARAGRNLHYFGGFLADRDTTVTDHWVLNLDDPLATWEAAAPLPTALGHQSVATLNGLIYIMGGQIRHDHDPIDLMGVYVYDPASDSWSTRASLPTPRSHAEPGTFILNGRIVLVGGRNNKILRPTEMNSVVMYDPPTDTWIALPKLPLTRIAPIAQPFGNRIIVTNGGQWWNNPQRNTWSGILDNSWELNHPALPTPLGEAASGIVGNQLLLASESSTATLAFDLAADSWLTPTLLAPRPLAFAGHAAEVTNQQLYLFGGSGDAAGKLQIYSPISDTWSLGAEVPFAAASSAVARIGDTIYLAGGQQEGQPASAVARYDVKANSWASLAPMPVAVSGAAAASDGEKLYIFGGSDAGGPTNLVQIYDPLAATWQTSAANSAQMAMPRARSNAGRALYIGGDFYLLGGKNSEGMPIAEIDIYNPSEQTWRQGPLQPLPRLGFWPALIADRIYLAGGTDNLGKPSTTFSVFNPVPRLLLPIPGETPTVTPSISPTNPSVTSTPTQDPTSAPDPTATPNPGETHDQARSMYLPIFINKSSP
jgi:N-acetylneuraminic acid mutarotase